VELYRGLEERRALIRAAAESRAVEA
jgi:hypothetical protein